MFKKTKKANLPSLTSVTTYVVRGKVIPFTPPQSGKGRGELFISRDRFIKRKNNL